jgi:uncharacterized membrane protein
MVLQIVVLAATVLVTIAAAIAVAGALRWPPRGGLAVSPIAHVQRAVRRHGIVLGFIEAGALIALLVALFKVPVGSTEMWLVGGAAVCVAAMIGIWAVWLRPLNVTIAGWDPDALPADWARHHTRWSTYHRLRVVLAIIATALLLMGLMAQPAW